MGHGIGIHVKGEEVDVVVGVAGLVVAGIERDAGHAPSHD